jgi:hypothetical protein
MGTVLGLLGFILFVAAVSSFAAGVTWVVVRVFPQKKPKPEPQAS